MKPLNKSIKSKNQSQDSWIKTALGERIRTLFKEQSITIISILTAVCMAIGVLIEALLGGPMVSTTTTTSAGDGKVVELGCG